MAAVALIATWYVPCPGSTCTLTRHLGFRSEITKLARHVPENERAALLVRLEALYPKSAWVWYLVRDSASTSAAKVAADQAIVRRFPLASPAVYLELARLELERGNRAAARDTLEHGLAVFPPALSPAGVPLVSRSQEYSTWVTDAQALLASLSD